MQIGLLQFQDLLYLSNVKHVVDFHKYNMYARKDKDVTSTSRHVLAYIQLTYIAQNQIFISFPAAHVDREVATLRADIRHRIN